MRRRCGLLLTKQIGNGFACDKPLRGFAELLCLDGTGNPAVKYLDDSCSRLEILRAHRADGVSGDMCARVHKSEDAAGPGVHSGVGRGAMIA
jgi:hypothetical protein